MVSFTPGAAAGFGQDRLPGVVLGPPHGEGEGSGSLDVVSLGRDGTIVLALDGVELVDGPGADLMVFENPFVGFTELGLVAVSSDGTSWQEWPCQPADPASRFLGCAGRDPVYANPENGISACDPARAGGDSFDLADVGVTRARFVRIRDSGVNRTYSAPGGGFDLDAIAVIHGEPMR